MDKDRIKGAVHKAKGTLKEATGKVTVIAIALIGIGRAGDRGAAKAEFSSHI